MSLIFLLLAYYSSVAEPVKTLFMIIFMVLLYLPDFNQIYIESKEQGKFILGKNGVISIGLLVFFIILIVIKSMIQ